MNKSGNNQTKEATKTRRKLNRLRRRKNRQILKFSFDELALINFKNTSGWLTW